MSAPDDALFPVVDSHYPGDEHIAVLVLVEKYQPNDASCFFQEYETFDVLLFSEVALLIVDNLLLCHMRDEAVRRLFGEDRASGDRQNERQGKQEISVHGGLLGDTVAMHEIVRNVRRNSSVLIERHDIHFERLLRDVLVPPPHVRRPKELSRAELVYYQVAVAQSLHIVLSAILHGIVGNKTPFREFPLSRGNHSDWHMTSISLFYP